MKANTAVMAAGTVLLVAVTAVVTHVLTKRAVAPASGATGTESHIIKEVLTVHSVAERYTRAVTAQDEPAAAELTRDMKDGGMLWIGAVGRRITVLRVVGIFIEPVEPPGAEVLIQVEGKPSSSITLQKSDGAWSVWP